MSRLPPLYAIADDDAARAAGWPVDDLAIEYLSAGVRLLQLRSKRHGSGELLRLIDRVVARAREVEATLIVNDRVDLMLLAGASGVHVGQTDLPPSAVRSLVGPDPIVGFSTHTTEQVDLAVTLPISYLAVGPVFATGSKDTGYAPVGLELVRYAREKTTGPIVAIGGISLDRAPDALEAGADCVAVIADLLGAGPPAGRVAEYLAVLARP